jgi:DNA-binding transcriptional MerR regulator
MDHAKEVLFTATEAAELLGVEPATITKWSARGRLTPAGRKGRAHLYRWGDLSEAEYQTRRTGHLPKVRNCPSI